MKMNLGQLEVQVRVNKQANGMTKAEKAYKNQRAIKHYQKQKEKVSTDYFFGM